jgi:hypothetical protein
MLRRNVLHGERMRDSWIDSYAGSWHDAEGRTLVIAIHDDEHAIVDLLVNGEPMSRSWSGGSPAVGLSARYRPIDGPSLDIELGRPGFSLIVNYEFAEPPYEPESLSVAVSSYETDKGAEALTKHFGKLGRYTRRDAEHQNAELSPAAVASDEA